LHFGRIVGNPETNSLLLTIDLWLRGLLFMIGHSL
jgi:hypothetical protein